MRNIRTPDAKMRQKPTQNLPKGKLLNYSIYKTCSQDRDDSYFKSIRLHSTREKGRTDRWADKADGNKNRRTDRQKGKTDEKDKQTRHGQTKGQKKMTKKFKMA